MLMILHSVHLEFCKGTGKRNEFILASEKYTCLAIDKMLSLFY